MADDDQNGESRDQARANAIMGRLLATIRTEMSENGPASVQMECAAILGMLRVFLTDHCPEDRQVLFAEACAKLWSMHADAIIAEAQARAAPLIESGKGETWS